ncbi:MAG: glucokinase [Gammaproteobacteria bacterium]
MSAADTPFLTADVGGTHARIALMRTDHDALSMLAYHKYLCADYPSLGAILQDFIATRVHEPPHTCTLACAGYLQDGMVVNYNLPWQVSMTELCSTLGIERISVINDFEAVAHAARFVDAAKTLQLGGPHQAAGTLVVIGPGTGLGSAVSIPAKPHDLVLATEAGQMSLAPDTEIEREILARLAGDLPYVSYERVLCGPGLVTLYRALGQIRAMPATLSTPEAVTASALGRSDHLAEETLQVFCALLGSYAGNLALAYGARGGVYLTGGILPAMRGFLAHSHLMPRFLAKERMRGFLERIPVKLLEQNQLGVLGAARWHLRQRKT